MRGITDILFILVALFLFGFILIVAGWINSSMLGMFKGVADNNSIQPMQQYTNAEHGLDSLSIFLVVGLIAAAVLSAYMVKNTPALFPFALVLWGILIVGSAIFSNFYFQFFNTTAFVNETVYFSHTSWIMANLPLITIGAGALVFVAVFMK